MRSVLLAVYEPIKICDVPYHFAKACLPEDKVGGVEAVEIIGKSEPNEHAGIWRPLSTEDLVLLARIWEGLPQPNEVAPENFLREHIAAFENSPERPSWGIRWNPTRAPSINARKSFQDQLEKDIRAGVLVLRDPVTLIPVTISDAYGFGFYVRASFVVTIVDLKEYAKRFEITVNDDAESVISPRYRKRTLRNAAGKSVQSTEQSEALSKCRDNEEEPVRGYVLDVEQFDDEARSALAEQVYNGEPIKWNYWRSLKNITPVQAAKLVHSIDPIKWPASRCEQGEIPRDISEGIERLTQWLAGRAQAWTLQALVDTLVPEQIPFGMSVVREQSEQSTSCDALMSCDSQNGKQNSKSDRIAPVIDEAKANCSSPKNAQAVFLVLEGWARDEKPKPPLIGVGDEDGKPAILWRDNYGETKKLTVKKLRDRMRKARRNAA